MAEEEIEEAEETETVKVTVALLRVARAFLYDGATNQMIADRVRRSEDTIKTQMKTLFQLTGAKDRSHLAVLFWSGRLDLESPTCPSLRESLVRTLGLESSAPD